MIGQVRSKEELAEALKILRDAAVVGQHVQGLDNEMQTMVKCIELLMWALGDDDNPFTQLIAECRAVDAKANKATLQ